MSPVAGRGGASRLGGEAVDRTQQAMDHQEHHEARGDPEGDGQDLGAAGGREGAEREAVGPDGVDSGPPVRGGRGRDAVRVVAGCPRRAGLGGSPEGQEAPVGRDQREPVESGGLGGAREVLVGGVARPRGRQGQERRGFAKVAATGDGVASIGVANLREPRDERCCEHENRRERADAPRQGGAWRGA